MSERKNSTWIWIVAGLILIVGLFLIFGKKDSVAFDWKETYEEKSKEPYGLFIFHDLLNSYFPGNKMIEVGSDLKKSLKDASSGSSNYVFVGEADLLDSADCKVLYDFIKKGNTALIASKSIPLDLLKQIREIPCVTPKVLNSVKEAKQLISSSNTNIQTEEDSVEQALTVTDMDEEEYDEEDLSYDTLYYSDYYNDEPSEKADLSLEEFRSSKYDTLTCKRVVKNKPVYNAWEKIPDNYFCDSLAIQLGSIDGSPNFGKIRVGSGSLILFSTPIIFTNYELCRDSSLHFVEHICSYLNPGTIYWEKSHRGDLWEGKLLNTKHGVQNEPHSKSPLRYILSQPGLAWSWYILLALGLFYVVFYAKRRQRVIPVLPENTNDSLEYVQTVGRLHFILHDNRQLCLTKMKHFLQFLRERYHLNYRHEEEKYFISEIARRSRTEEALLKSIFHLYHQFEQTYVTDTWLIDFHHAIQEFQQTCK